MPRVRNVPNVIRANAPMTSVMFHNRAIPRRSCSMTEWRKAVETNQGSKATFSTGSQAQYPPQPSTEYDHSAPRQQADRQEAPHHSVHRRMSETHCSDPRPASNAAMPNANGTVKPMNPR